MVIQVKSIVIHWQENTSDITSRNGDVTHFPLDKIVHVTMIGYPEREEKTLTVRELGPFISKGYIVEEIKTD